MEPRLVSKPPVGGDWSHEVKFDGYRSQNLSDFGALRKAITRRQHDLYFVAFVLLYLNGDDLRDMALEADLSAVYNPA